MRTLTDALVRAKSLRDFKESSPDRFEKSEDFQDVVNLADEVEKLKPIIDAALGWFKSDRETFGEPLWEHEADLRSACESYSSSD